MVRLSKFRKPVLLHATDWASYQSIYYSDVLLTAPYGVQCVSFTRSLEFAQYWAGIKDEGEGSAIMVLDRDKLAHRYKIEPFRDSVWDEDPDQDGQDEAEEQVWRDIFGIRQYILETYFFKDGIISALKTDQRTAA